MEKNSATIERSFYIVEPDPIISMDLHGVVQSSFPQSAVKVVSDADAVVTELQAALQQAATFVINSSVVTEEALEALRAAVTHGAQVLFIGGSVAADFHAACVEMPFTSQMILDALT